MLQGLSSHSLSQFTSIVHASDFCLFKMNLSRDWELELMSLLHFVISNSHSHIEQYKSRERKIDRQSCLEISLSVGKDRSSCAKLTGNIYFFEVFKGSKREWVWRWWNDICGWLACSHEWARALPSLQFSLFFAMFRSTNYLIVGLSSWRCDSNEKRAKTHVKFNRI